MKKLFFIISVIIFSATSAWAVDLETARKTGLVGEKPDGYVEAVSGSPSAEIAGLVQDINKKRKAAYKDISTKNGQALDLVEKLAAEKIIKNLGAGEYYKDEGGNWVRK